MAVPGISANRSRGRPIRLPQPALPVLSVALAGAQTMGAAAVSRQAPTLDGNGRLAASSRRMPMSPTRSKRCNRT